MGKLLVLGILLLLLSCNSKSEHSISKNEVQHDSILFYYELSLEKELPLNKKLNAINKAFFHTKKDGADTLFPEIIYQKSFLHFALKEYDSLLLYSNLLINRPRQFNLGKQYYLKAYYFDEIVHIPDSAFFNYSLSKNQFQHFGDSIWIGKNLLNMGLIQQNQSDFFGSKETITEALQYLEPKKDFDYIASAYSALALNHRKLLNHEDALAFYKKALETTTAKSDVPIIKNNMAATLIDGQQYNKGIELLGSIVNDPLLLSQSTEYARVLDNLAYAMWSAGEKGGDSIFQTALQIRIDNNDIRGQIASYTHLGEFYGVQDKNKAKAYFDTVIHLSKMLKNPVAERDAIKHLMHLDPQNLKLRNRYIFLQDNLYAKELKVKTQFAKYKYDDKLKQESILRLEKENGEKELEASRQRNQKIVSLGGLFLLASISGFAYYGVRQRNRRLKQENKTAKLEAIYETEAELSRKLHDDFGGKLNHVMLLLQNGENNPEILNIVDRLYNQSRDFSREINDVDTGPQFKDILLGMMGNYCKNTKLIVTGSPEVDWSRISSLSKKTLFKVSQELMINMQKYSRANLVTVVFEQSKKTLKVSYADNGVGATKEALHLKNGIWNIEKRIQDIGGTINFDTTKESGFEAQIEIPN